MAVQLSLDEVVALKPALGAFNRVDAGSKYRASKDGVEMVLAFLPEKGWPDMSRYSVEVSSDGITLAEYSYESSDVKLSEEQRPEAVIARMYLHARNTTSLRNAREKKAALDKARGLIE